MTFPYAETFIQAAVHDERPPIDFFRDRHWSGLWQSREYLVIRAAEAAGRHGRSYRDFRVGAAAYVTCQEPERLRARGQIDYRIYTGANWKLGPDQRNTCVEQEVTGQIRQNDQTFPVERILALAVYGSAQDEPDAESGIKTTTLHPCRHCRRLLMNTPTMRPDTIIMTATPDGTSEFMLFSELLRLHGVV